MVVTPCTHLDRARGLLTSPLGRGPPIFELPLIDGEITARSFALYNASAADATADPLLNNGRGRSWRQPLSPAAGPGAWVKMRVNKARELTVGSIVVGFYEHDDLVYVARVRNGFTPSLRE